MDRVRSPEESEIDLQDISVMTVENLISERFVLSVILLCFGIYKNV